MRFLFHHTKPIAMKQDFEIEPYYLKKAELHFKAVNHPLRQQILNLLNLEGRMAVTTLYIKLRVEQSLCSQHLAILRRAGMVFTKKVGKQVFYSLNYQRLKELHTLAKALTQSAL